MDLPSIIYRCCQIKAEIVEADEKETASTGGRALLNLGHTFAHAIEAVAGYGAYLHGEAVGIGLHCAALLSERLGWLERSEVDQVVRVIEANRLPSRLWNPLSVQELLDAMAKDKKVRSGRIKFIAMRSLGEAVTVENIDLEWIRQIWGEVGT